MKTTIQNEFLTVTVDTHGAEAISVKNQLGEELIWQADPSIWDRHSPVLFPWTGRLANSELVHEGKHYKGKQHGFIRDLEHTLVENTGTSAQFVFRSNQETKDTLFPFDFEFISVFTLDGHTLHHEIKVKNCGSEKMRFGIGFHPGFNLPFDEKHKTEDYELRFECEESPVILDCLPHGLLSGKSFYQWKNAQSIQLTDTLFDNDSFCLAGLRSKSISLCEKDSGRSITCDISEYPYTLLWSARTKPMRFVCIEPWQSLPAAETDTSEWNEHAAAACIGPDESYSVALNTTFNR